MQFNFSYFQSSATDISVNWDSFIDVEELGFAVHETGIARYEVALGMYIRLLVH